MVIKLLLGIIVVIIIIIALKVKNGRCKFANKCRLYDPNSCTCNEGRGMYYEFDRPSGCWRANEKSGKYLKRDKVNYHPVNEVASRRNKTK